MESTVQAVTKRPGGRTADVTARVHQAIIDLLVEGGVKSCTFSAVAERAGVDRSTLYRRFPDRWDAIIDAWIARAGAEVMPDGGHSFAEDLKSVLRRLTGVLESPLGPALLSAAAQLRNRDESEYSQAFFDRRMAQLGPMFDAAVARGELSPDVDREGLFSFAAGPVYFRVFIAARPVEDDFLDSIVDSVCCLYGPAPEVPSRKRLA